MERIVLDGKLISSLFTLIAAVALAVVAIVLQPEPRAECGAGRTAAGSSTPARVAPSDSEER